MEPPVPTKLGTGEVAGKKTTVPPHWTDEELDDFLGLASDKEEIVPDSGFELEDAKVSEDGIDEDLIATGESDSEPAKQAPRCKRLGAKQCATKIRMTKRYGG